MLKIKQILDKNNVPYEELNYEGFNLIIVYQYPVNGLSKLAKKCSI